LLTPELDAAPERWTPWESLTSAIAAAPLVVRRGTQAYNPLAFGWILAEIVRRVAGSSLPEFVRAKFPAELAGLEFMRSPGAVCATTLWRGPAHLVIAGNDIAPSFEAINNAVSGISALVPGAGMFTNARTLALFYETLARGGTLPSGRQWLSRETVRRYTGRVSTRWDRSLRFRVVEHGVVLWPCGRFRRRRVRRRKVRVRRGHRHRHESFVAGPAPALRSTRLRRDTNAARRLDSAVKSA
jgi:CubicO group peptidase (beta-lactamase class C family)